MEFTLSVSLIPVTMKALLKSWCCKNNHLYGAKAFYLLVLGFSTMQVHAQINLVPNPSFEIQTNCPDGLGKLSYAIPWSSIPASGGVDLWDTCKNGLSGAYQNVRTGHAMIAMLVYKTAFQNVREYAQIRLTDS